MSTWYALQHNRSNSWEYGTYDFSYSLKMLQSQGHGLIAVIDEDTNTCIREILFDDLCDYEDLIFDDSETNISYWFNLN